MGGKDESSIGIALCPVNRLSLPFRSALSASHTYSSLSRVTVSPKDNMVTTGRSARLQKAVVDYDGGGDEELASDDPYDEDNLSPEEHPKRNIMDWPTTKEPGLSKKKQRFQNKPKNLRKVLIRALHRRHTRRLLLIQRRHLHRSRPKPNFLSNIALPRKTMFHPLFVISFFEVISRMCTSTLSSCQRRLARLRSIGKEIAQFERLNKI